MNTVFESGKSGIGFFGAVLAAIQRLESFLRYFILTSLEWWVFVDVIAYFSAGVIAVLVVLLVVLWEPATSIWRSRSVGWSKTATKTCSKWWSRVASGIAGRAISSAVWDQEGSGKACGVHCVKLSFSQTEWQTNEVVYILRDVKIFWVMLIW